MENINLFGRRNDIFNFASKLWLMRWPDSAHETQFGVDLTFIAVSNNIVYAQSVINCCK